MESVVNKYRQCTFADIPDDTYDGSHGHARIAPFDKHEPDRREELAQYYAAVDIIDRQMERVFAGLRSIGELDNTFIVYTSDHGHMNGHHSLHTKANATIPTNFFEESIHVPLLLRWSGVIKPGQAPGFPVDHCDLFSTLLGAAGVDATAAAREVKSPGNSYLRRLRGEQKKWRDYQICEHSYSRMIRTSRYKLIRRYPSKVARYPDEFFDLERDPRESANRIEEPEYARAISGLGTVIDDYFDRYVDPERSGTNMETIRKHNHRDPWEAVPGEDDHRQ